MTGLRFLCVALLMHSHEVDWQYDTELSERQVLGGLAKCRGLLAFYPRIEHWGQHDESEGVDEGEGARRYREELKRTVTRPRGSVEDIEDKTSAADLGDEADKVKGWQVQPIAASDKDQREQGRVMLFV